MTWESWRRQKAAEAPPRQMSKAEMHDEYDRLELAIQHARRYELENAELRGGLPQRRRIERKIDRLDGALNQLHQILFPIAMGSPFDGPEPTSANGCTWPDCPYVFKDDRAAWAALFTCPRHDGDPTTFVQPNDPNWNPVLDRNPTDYRR